LNIIFLVKLHNPEVRIVSVINTNMSALVATNAIIANDRAQEVAMERLSTGLRINSASDDAAGLAISSRMEAEVSGLNMATRNANDAISMIETIEGSSREIGAALQRMRELAVQAASDTYGVTDRAALDMEFGQLFLEMQRIATQTTWNQMTVMNGGNDLATSAVTSSALTIQIGKASGQNMPLVIKSFDPQTTMKTSARSDVVNATTGAITAGNLGARGASAVTVATNGGGTALVVASAPVGLSGAQITAAAGSINQDGNDNHNSMTPTEPNRRLAETQAFGSAVLFVGMATAAAQNTIVGGGQRIDILSRGNANYALAQLDTAISAVSAERAKYGSYMSRLEHAGDNMTNVARHVEQSRSRIADADYAVETSELSRTTIIAQASTAMLAQANAAKQTVLTLLQ
jgi:flagellin